MLVVGIPVDANAVQQEIVIKRFDNDDKTVIPAVDAGGDNNDSAHPESVDFGKNLKQAFVVLENEAGSHRIRSAST